MASTQEAEIIFAQKLASNEKPIRSKALLKLRKYISVRSEKGGFSEDELLKIWKGLFYCLWMQDLPLLQEELSTKISALLHSFRTVDSQFLYFKTFLQTMKREWNGIDRLRMDKFYQCVRFVFREVFEMLKRQDWKPSVVNEFLELISGQLLQSSSSAPSGLILHILDLYLNELALIGSATLTAEQNQTFIEPFCKAMAKTKDRVLLKAIGSNIFNTIVDQVPFAIEDLLREIRQNEGRESEDEESGNDQMKMKAAEDDDHEEDSSDLGDDFSYEKDVKGGAECEAVLQFDYGAIADRLFKLASYTNIPSFNRSKIYKFVKIFRDLTEGVFPQDEVEDVSSEEDDDDDNRRRRKKKKRLNKQSQEKTDKADTESSEITPETDPSKKKKKKGKKRRLKGIEDQTGSDVDRPMIETVDVPASKPLNNHTKKKAKGLLVNEEQSKHMITITDPPKEQPDSSDLRPVKKQKKRKKNESECGADEDLSVVPPALQKKKKRKLKKKQRCADDGETTGDCSQTDDKQTDNCCAEIHTDTTAPDLSTTTLKKKKTKKTSPDDPSDVTEEKTKNKMKVKKSKIKKKAVRSEECRESDETAEMLHIDEKQTQSHENTETNTVNKKKKKKLKSVELNGETNERVRRKRNIMNGHAEPESVKKQKIVSESDKPTNQMNTKGFAFSPKKSPTALFCRSAGFITPVCKKQSLRISKSETKKVTFGLKNNKTMEFRKMDRSSLLSPAGRSQVAFDPKKTPKSGVLKSPTSSPAIRRRSTAADFF